MLIITVQVDAPRGKAIGVKEDLAMYLEKYGDARVVSVEERPGRAMDQMKIGDGFDGKSGKVSRMWR